MKGIMLERQGKTFVIKMSNEEGLNNLRSFESREDVVNYLNQTGMRINWYGDNISTFDIFLHFKKFEQETFS